MSASAKRHPLKELQQRVDRVTASDAKFFERFPNRHHRVRHASEAELKQNAAMTGARDQAPAPGKRWFVAVRQVAPGIRMRLFAESADDADVDLTEGEAKQVFDFVAVANDAAIEVERKLAALAARGRG